MKQAEAEVCDGSSVTWQVEGSRKGQATADRFFKASRDDTRSKPLFRSFSSLSSLNVIPTHQKVPIPTVLCSSLRPVTHLSPSLNVYFPFPCRKLGAEFLCRVRYRNNLPPLPFAPKLIATPPLTARFVKYESTSLIEKTPYALAVDQDLGMPIDVATVQYLERLELGGGQDDQGEQRVVKS